MNNFSDEVSRRGGLLGGWATLWRMRNVFSIYEKRGGLRGFVPQAAAVSSWVGGTVIGAAGGPADSVGINEVTRFLALGAGRIRLGETGFNAGGRPRRGAT